MPAEDRPVGRIIEIKGVVLDAVFDGHLPAIYNALEITMPDGRTLVAEVQQHLGDDRVRAVAMDATDGLARGTAAYDTGASISVPVGDATLGRIFNVLGETIDKGDDTAIDDGAALGDPPRAAGVRHAHADGRDLRDRHQGHRPARPVREGRQGRPLRRRRRGQDGADPGADQQHRDAARRPLGVRRRRRAHARGQRPLARDDRVRRDREDGARLRPDERAARRPSARRPERPDDGGVLPRRGRAGRPALHRQHLPLRAGGLRGLGAARPHAERRGLPADARDRDGRAAGAHHLDDQGLDHVGAGDLRAGRRPHRPGAREHVRAPRRDHDALALDLGEGHLPGRRPARLHVAHPPAGRRLRRALRRRHARAAAAAALQGPAGHHRDPRHGRALRRGQGRRAARPQDRALPLAAVLRRRRSSPAAPGKYVKLEDTIRSFREVLEGKHDDLPEQAFYLQGDINDVLAAAEELAATSSA